MLVTTITNLNGEYADMKSITKFFVALMIHHLVHKKLLNYDDLVKKYIKNYPYDITILSIIQHTSGLENDWSTYDSQHADHHGGWVMSDLAQKYMNSKTPHKFTLTLKQIYIYGDFHYNNYAYDILCTIIQLITKYTAKDFLGKILFNKLNIKYCWYQSRGGYALGISKYDIPKLPNIVPFMKSIKYTHMQTYQNATIDGVKYFGHSGSDGQYMYFTPEYTHMYMIFNDNDQVDLSVFLKKIKYSTK